jgi:hypothetical protein
MIALLSVLLLATQTASSYPISLARVDPKEAGRCSAYSELGAEGFGEQPAPSVLADAGECVRCQAAGPEGCGGACYIACPAGQIARCVNGASDGPFCTAQTTCKCSVNTRSAAVATPSPLATQGDCTSSCTAKGPSGCGGTCSISCPAGRAARCINGSSVGASCVSQTACRCDP